MPPNNTVSWIWWVFSAVILALVINLVSSYLKSPIDRRLERYSESRRNKNELRRAEFEKLINELVETPALAEVLMAKQTRLIIQTGILAIANLVLILPLAYTFGVSMGNTSISWSQFGFSMFNFALASTLTVVAILVFLLFRRLGSYRSNSLLLKAYERKLREISRRQTA